jgi:predicted N-formylglutamate amidohydrolase
MACNAESCLSLESSPRLLLTCEHAVNTVPTRWAAAFASPRAQAALASHRGWDPGAAELAACFADKIPAPCLMGEQSRLLVELNRSPGHPQFWSEFSCGLPSAEKQDIVRQFYDPFRKKTRDWITSRLAGSPAPVFHLSVHSFTPVWEGVEREADIGILYDPSRPLAVHWAAAWESALHSLAPHWRIRRNYPYLGTDDGHTTALRTVFGPQAYVGIELEVNQALPLGNPEEWEAARRLLLQALWDSLFA